MKQWIGKNKNNEVIVESNYIWNDVKDDLSSLSFDNNGQIITLPNNSKYIQGKSASASLGSGQVTIESRYIGIYKNELKIILRINENTNNISLEISENNL